MTDIRTIRTKEKLRNSLERLLKEKEYEKISITNITDDSQINRVTFYTHYQGKDELLKDLIDNFANKCCASVHDSLEENKQIITSPEEFFSAYILSLVDYCIKNDSLVKNLSKAKDGMMLAYLGKAISNAIYPLTIKDAETRIKHAYTFSSTFFIAGYIEVVLNWLNDPIMPKDLFYYEIKDFTGKVVKSHLVYRYDD